MGLRFFPMRSASQAADDQFQRAFCHQARRGKFAAGDRDQSRWRNVDAILAAGFGRIGSIAARRQQRAESAVDELNFLFRQLRFGKKTLERIQQILTVLRLRRWRGRRRFAPVIRRAVQKTPVAFDQEERPAVEVSN